MCYIAYVVDVDHLLARLLFLLGFALNLSLRSVWTPLLTVTVTLARLCRNRPVPLCFRLTCLLLQEH